MLLPTMEQTERVTNAMMPATALAAIIAAGRSPHAIANLSLAYREDEYGHTRQNPRGDTLNMFAHVPCGRIPIQPWKAI